MDNSIAKTELLTNHFPYSLGELNNHFKEMVDFEALYEIGLMVVAETDGAIRKCQHINR